MKISKRILSVFLLFLCGFSNVYAQSAGGAISSPFTDVDHSNQYYDAIIYANDNNIFEGYSDGSFRPDSYINRAEFVKIIVKTFYGYDEVQNDETSSPSEIDFVDVEEGSWYIPFLRQGVSNGIIHGYEDGEFRPSNYINFAEAAKIISISARQDGFMTNNEVRYQPYIDYLAEYNAIPNSIATYDQLITRAETAQVIYDLSQTGASNIDSDDKIQINPSEDAELIITEGINKLITVSSFKYNVSFFADSYEPHLETIKFTFDGSLDARDMNNFSCLINFNILSDKNGDNEYSVRGKSLFIDNSVYFYLNDNSLINGDDSDYYFHKWWRYSVDTLFNQDIEQDESMIPFVDINSYQVLENTKYLGQNLVMGEESYHYSVELNEDELKSYLLAFISNSGETTNVDELDEMIEIFNLENTKIDLWIGTSSHILNKAKLVFKVKTDTKDIGNLEVFFAFSDFNKPIENVIPDAEALDIYKIYYLLFGVDILGTDL